MSRSKLLLLLAGLMLAGMFSGSTARADDRCYYSTWYNYSQRNYYYCTCNYRVEPAAPYEYHYVIYYPSQPRYCYYYNPKRSLFWGRYDLESAGYSLLEEKDRKGSLKEIPEEAFPKPGEMPQIPNSKDGVKLAVPPAPPKT